MHDLCRNIERELLIRLGRPSEADECDEDTKPIDNVQIYRGAMF